MQGELSICLFLATRMQHTIIIWRNLINHAKMWPKVKVKLSLCLTKHQAMKTYWGSGGIAPRILDLGTRWRWVVSFTSRERAPVTHWIGGWLDPRAVLDTVVNGELPSPRRESNTRSPIVHLVAQSYTDWAVTALKMWPNVWIFWKGSNKSELRSRNKD
jgi:hypothetical protein